MTFETNESSSNDSRSSMVAANVYLSHSWEWVGGLKGTNTSNALIILSAFRGYTRMTMKAPGRYFSFMNTTLKSQKILQSFSMGFEAQSCRNCGKSAPGLIMCYTHVSKYM